MTTPLRHNDDPKGYVVVLTNPATGTSCNQCALRKLPLCKDAPCYEECRPDGATIHYVKE